MGERERERKSKREQSREDDARRNKESETETRAKDEMVVYFSIPVFFAVIILAACGVVLADVVTSIRGFAVSSLSSSSSQVKAWWH